MNDANYARESRGARARDDESREPSGSETISELVMQEAAAAIVAAGRELTAGETPSVREFLRGPALKVGLALSVMGVTMWIAEKNQEHKRRQLRTHGTPHSDAAGSSMGTKRRPRRRATSAAAIGDGAKE